jgi:hypothetical protein
MKFKLIQFLNKYGNDFFHKLPKYRTAKWDGREYVKLGYFSPEHLSFVVTDTKNNSFTVEIFELDDFCL